MDPFYSIYFLIVYNHKEAAQTYSYWDEFAKILGLVSAFPMALQSIESQDLQPTAGLTFTLPQTEVKDNSASLGGGDM